jgi:hypothetical protein
MMPCNDWSGTKQKSSPTLHGPSDTNEWEHFSTVFTSTANFTGMRWINYSQHASRGEVEVRSKK